MSRKRFPQGQNLSLGHSHHTTNVPQKENTIIGCGLGPSRVLLHLGCPLVVINPAPPGYGPTADSGRQQDKRLKEGLMPVACKKPVSRLQRAIGSRVTRRQYASRKRKWLRLFGEFRPQLTGGSQEQTQTTGVESGIILLN